MILDFLAVLCSPKFWVQLHELSHQWDDELNRLLDNGYRFTNISSHMARLGVHNVWIANHPYASFTTDPGSIRPKRRTIRKAHRHLMQDYWSEHMQEGL